MKDVIDNKKVMQNLWQTGATIVGLDFRVLHKKMCSWHNSNNLMMPLGYVNVISTALTRA